MFQGGGGAWFGDRYDGAGEGEELWPVVDEDEGGVGEDYLGWDSNNIDVDDNNRHTIVDDEDDDAYTTPDHYAVMKETRGGSAQFMQATASHNGLEYPDASLIDREAGSRHSVKYPNPVPKQPKAASATRAEKSTGFNVFPAVPNMTAKRNTRSSKNSTAIDIDSSSVRIKDDPDGSPAVQPRRSTRLSKCIKVLADTDDENDDDEENEGEKRVRKVSKLNLKIAKGMAPKRGVHGPIGEVRFKEDGSMEFRDVENEEWTPAAYHKDHRRRFLDEAAQLGKFDYTPSRGTAKDDETSFEPDQQSWGPSRADWQNIVDGQGKKVMFQVEKPKTRRPPEEPKNWILDGCVLLDSKNHPVKDWPGLNKTLSTEVESWRWEALMRLHPWLRVADLLARMPNEREDKGVIVPRQTSQAFTNRAHRFRVPNQIPTVRPKNGSRTYREEILTNLAKENATTTESLSILNPDQIGKVREKNKGKFVGNSRYVSSDYHPPKTQAAANKRKARGDEDEEAETDRKDKRPCANRAKSLDAGIQYDVDAGHTLKGERVTEPIRSTVNWGDLNEQMPPWCNMAAAEEQQDDSLVPLFASVHDRKLAVLADRTWTSPGAVICARRAGNGRTRHIGVFWYRSNIPRHWRPDGNIVYDVVHSSASRMYEFEENIPGDEILGFQREFPNPSFTNPPWAHMQGSLPAATTPMFNQRTYQHPGTFSSQVWGGNQPVTTSPWNPYPPLYDGTQQIGGFHTHPDGPEGYWPDPHGFGEF